MPPRSTLLLVLLALPVPGQNCAGTLVQGLVPLVDLGPGGYQGLDGGLYGAEQNGPPAAHAALGAQLSGLVQPRDAQGLPSPSGSIVLLSVGMSNTSQEFAQFIPLSNADPQRNPLLVPVNGAQGGQTAQVIADPGAPFWTVIETRLAQAGVTPAQVQVVWLKEANANPSGGFPFHAQTLRAQLGAIARILLQKYPNCRLAFLSSRIYAGYATTTLNPEPYAYESAFAVRWTIQDQIGGDPGLNADPAVGPVMAPWLAWGPYLWANGLLPRSDGWTWACSEFQPDGTHPGPAGALKVAAALHAFFSQDPRTAGFYLGGGPGLAQAALVPYGQGCAGSAGVPAILANTLPRLGTADFRIGVQNARPGAAATLFVSQQLAAIALPGGCTAWIDPVPPELLLPAPGAEATVPTNPGGSGFLAFSIPLDPALAGLSVFAQWAIADPLGALSGSFALTQGLQILIGL
jgi:hypothetical protein